MSPVRIVQSVTVTPASADAQTFPGGQVQFSATGHFNTAPMTAPIQVQWSVGAPGDTTIPTGVKIDPSTGIAQCSGFAGTTTISGAFAGNPDVPLPSTAVQVIGTAQLTCP